MTFPVPRSFITFLAPSATADSILAWWHNSSTRRSKGLMMALSCGQWRTWLSYKFFFFFLWVLWLRSFRTKYIFTNHVVVLKAQLVGLACLEDLHSDELDLHLAVLKHLLRRCQQLAILRAKNRPFISVRTDLLTTTAKRHSNIASLIDQTPLGGGSVWLSCARNKLLRIRDHR